MKSVMDMNGDAIRLGEKYRDQETGVEGVISAWVVPTGAPEEVQLHWDKGETLHIVTYGINLTVPVVPLKDSLDELADLCEGAWGLIAVAMDGDDKTRKEWHEAAWRWKRRWLKTSPESQREELEANEEKS